MLHRFTAMVLALSLIPARSAAAADSALHETVTPQFKQTIPNIPGKTLTVVIQ